MEKSIETLSRFVIISSFKLLYVFKIIIYFMIVYLTKFYVGDW